MRVCHCQFDCFFNSSSLANHSPCSLNLGDVKDVVVAKPVQVGVDLEKKLSDGDESKLEGVRVEVVLKSSLKKGDGCSPKGVEKGRVKWMDFVGKELVEIREFEALQSRELEEMMNGNHTCMCTIL